MVDSCVQQEAVLGAPREHHESIDSTNRRALELAAAGAPHGTMITAAEQTASHGRQGRSWTSPVNTSPSMSLVIREPSPLLWLAVAVAVAVAETVDRLWEEQPQDARAMIKWPADVLVDGRKVAGIDLYGQLMVDLGDGIENTVAAARCTWYGVEAGYPRAAPSCSCSSLGKR
jgi:biotin-(acetyl-CoA carboxylase) ligase